MRNEFLVKYPKGKPDTTGVVCAHCGFSQSDTIRPHFTYQSCDCPGHLGKTILGFDEMEDLPQRLQDFETWLENEPCTQNGRCDFMSAVRMHCPSCRLRLCFFHCIYNAEAYRKV